MEKITLTMKEEKRVMVMEKVFRRELKMAEAAEVPGISERQTYRIKARIRLKGAKGVVHGNRGRICPWRISKEDREKILNLYKEKYQCVD